MRGRLLYLVRHGEADSEDELTDRGVRQAELVGRRLRDLPFEAIHHSTQPRAVATAKIIAGFLPGVPVVGSDLLRECIPSVPDPAVLTPSQVTFFASWSEEELAEQGPAQAAAAVKRFAGVDGG